MAQQQKKGNVKFIRKNGKVIPIKPDGGSSSDRKKLSSLKRKKRKAVKTQQKATKKQVKFTALGGAAGLAGAALSRGLIPKKLGAVMGLIGGALAAGTSSISKKAFSQEADASAEIKALENNGVRVRRKKRKK